MRMLAVVSSFCDTLLFLLLLQGAAKNTWQVPIAVCHGGTWHLARSKTNEALNTECVVPAYTALNFFFFFAKCLALT